MARSAFVSRDGKSSVDQGDWYPVQSVGSNTMCVDLDTILNWWERIRPVDPAPEPIQLDENGVPFRLCSGYERGSHYAPIRAFSKHKGRRDGLETECKQCRHERDSRLKVTNFTRNAGHG